MTARLLKVIVQPVFVAEQDDDLTEIVVAPIVMSAAQWRELDPQTFAKDGAEQVADQLVRGST